MKKLIILIIIVIVIAISLLYYTISQNLTTMKSKRVSCQEKTITFEKIFNDTPIKRAIELFESNNIIIKSNIEYSKYMKSHLITILDKKQVDNILKNVIKTFIKNDINTKDKLLIDYYLYENDKNDLGKKNKKAKEYAGYLVFQFKYNNKLIYKIQTDYTDINGKDIKERITCIINSFVTLKENR